MFVRNCLCNAQRTIQRNDWLLVPLVVMRARSMFLKQRVRRKRVPADSGCLTCVDSSGLLRRNADTGLAPLWRPLSIWPFITVLLSDWCYQSSCRKREGITWLWYPGAAAQMGRTLALRPGRGWCCAGAGREAVWVNFIAGKVVSRHAPALEISDSRRKYQQSWAARS